MCPFRPISAGRFLLILCIVLGLFLASRARVSAQPPDPVEELRVALKDVRALPTVEERKARKERLDKIIPKLQNVSDLRRALTLTEWRDEEVIKVSSKEIQELAKIDRDARKQIGNSLKKWISDAVESKDAIRQRAAATLVGEIGASIRGLEAGDQSGYGRTLAPSLIALTRKDDPAVRQDAARALGKIYPEPQEAVAALDAMLRKDAGDRIAAADALVLMITNAVQLQQTGRTRSGVELLPADVVVVGTHVARTAGAHAGDGEPMVRRQTLTALVDSALALEELIPSATDIPELEDLVKKLDANKLDRFSDISKAKNYKSLKAAVPEFTDSLNGLGKVVKDDLKDNDEQTRVLARQVLMALAALRNSLSRLPAPADVKGERDPLMKALEPGLKEISTHLTDPNVTVRRATIDFLEPMRSAIGPAIPAVVKALGDEDRFIRWAAARTLAGIGEDNIKATANKTVPALARLMDPREDPQVRDAAAITLGSYGAEARAALPALIAFVDYGDLEARDSAVRAIQNIGGPDLAKAVPALQKALSSQRAYVRSATATALGSMGPVAAPAIQDLRALLNDNDAGVRTAASEALLQITKK
jgi:HEAT repeat protein